MLNVSGIRTLLSSCRGLQLIVFFACYILAPETPLRAAEIVIVQSGPLKPYQEATEGILRALKKDVPNGGGPKSLLDLHIEIIVLDDITPEESWRHIIRKHRPSLVMAVGAKALRTAVPISNLPIVYLMTPWPDEIIDDREQVRGVSMIVPPHSSLIKLHKHFPQIRRVAVLYSPQYSRTFIEEARRAAELFRYRLFEFPVESITDVPETLASLDDSIEAVWMIPDPNIVSSQTVPAFLNTSFSKGVLLLTFAEKYLELGATFAVVPNNSQMGQSAAALGRAMLDNKRLPDATSIKPLAFHVFQNDDILAKIAGIREPSEQHLETR